MGANKKTTKKKTARKRAATKKTTEKVAREPSSGKYSFDVLADENLDLANSVQGTLQGLRERRKNQPVHMKRMSDVRHSMVPLRHFHLQRVLSNYGLPEHSLIEIIGGENIGKSTLAMWLMGGAMLHGIPCALQETEGKPLLVDWVRRALHSDRALADRMLQSLEIFEHVNELNQMDKNMVDWVNVMRGRVPGLENPVPLDTPLVMVVDSWSKLMSKAEAAGFMDYGDHQDAAAKKKFKDVNEGSNLGHSKWAHNWSRRMPNFLEANNLILILIEHQNAKIDMSGGGGSFMSAEQGALWNKTRIGGKAFDQNSALQLIVANGGVIKDGSGVKVGHTVRMRVEKNSYGPKNGELRFGVRTEKFEDTDSYLQPSIDMNEEFAKWLADEKLLGVTASRKRYTCKVLGLMNAVPEDLGKAFHANGEVMNKLGADLKLHGYSQAVEKTEASLAPPPPPAEDTPQPSMQPEPGEGNKAGSRQEDDGSPPPEEKAPPPPAPDE